MPGKRGRKPKSAAIEPIQQNQSMKPEQQIIINQQDNIELMSMVQNNNAINQGNQVVQNSSRNDAIDDDDNYDQFEDSPDQVLNLKNNPYDNLIKQNQNDQLNKQFDQKMIDEADQQQLFTQSSSKIVQKEKYKGVEKLEDFLDIIGYEKSLSNPNNKNRIFRLSQLCIPLEQSQTEKYLKVIDKMIRGKKTQQNIEQANEKRMERNMVNQAELDKIQNEYKHRLKSMVNACQNQKKRVKLPEQKQFSIQNSQLLTNPNLKYNVTLNPRTSRKELSKKLQTIQQLQRSGNIFNPINQAEFFIHLQFQILKKYNRPKQYGPSLGLQASKASFQNTDFGILDGMLQKPDDDPDANEWKRKELSRHKAMLAQLKNKLNRNPSLIDSAYGSFRVPNDSQYTFMAPTHSQHSNIDISSSNIVRNNSMDSGGCGGHSEHSFMHNNNQNQMPQPSDGDFQNPFFAINPIYDDSPRSNIHQQTSQSRQSSNQSNISVQNQNQKAQKDTVSLDPAKLQQEQIEKSKLQYEKQCLSDLSEHCPFSQWFVDHAEGRQLWGRLHQPKQPQLGTLFDPQAKLFSVLSSHENKANNSAQFQYNSNIRYNEHLLDIEKLWNTPCEDFKKTIELDLNNSQYFFENIHGANYILNSNTIIPLSDSEDKQNQSIDVEQQRWIGQAIQMGNLQNFKKRIREAQIERKRQEQEKILKQKQEKQFQQAKEPKSDAESSISDASLMNTHNNHNKQAPGKIKQSIKQRLTDLKIVALQCKINPEEVNLKTEAEIRQRIHQYQRDHMAVDNMSLLQMLNEQNSMQLKEINSLISKHKLLHKKSGIQHLPYAVSFEYVDFTNFKLCGGEAGRYGAAFTQHHLRFHRHDIQQGIIDKHLKLKLALEEQDRKARGIVDKITSLKQQQNSINSNTPSTIINLSMFSKGKEGSELEALIKGKNEAIEKKRQVKKKLQRLNMEVRVSPQLQLEGMPSQSLEDSLFKQEKFEILLDDDDDLLTTDQQQQQQKIQMGITHLHNHQPRNQVDYDSQTISLFEYLEEFPLLMQDPGMGAKLYKHVFANNCIQNIFGNISAEDNKQISGLELLKKSIEEQLGTQGMVLFDNDTALHCLQLNNQMGADKVGMLVLENNLFAAPVFVQQLPKTDFLLQRDYDQDTKQYKYNVRKIDYIYTVGQIEPKEEVFTPNSRVFNQFQQRCLVLYVKKVFQNGGYINLKHIMEIFPQFTKHQVTRTIKFHGGYDFNNTSIFTFSQEKLIQAQAMAQNDQFDNAKKDKQKQEFQSGVVSCEEMCLYEKMLQGLARLRGFGLTNLRTADKLGQAKHVLHEDFAKDPEQMFIFQLILDELRSTPWSLSGNFLQAQEGRCKLSISADSANPLRDCGGVSYIKLLLKNRYNNLQPGEEHIHQPTRVLINQDDTKKDIRRLHIDKLNEILSTSEYKDTNYMGMKKSDKIELLKTIIKDNPSLLVYQRDDKFSMTMEVKNELREIIRNERFEQQMRLLSMKESAVFMSSIQQNSNSNQNQQKASDNTTQQITTTQQEQYQGLEEKATILYDQQLASFNKQLGERTEGRSEDASDLGQQSRNFNESSSEDDDGFTSSSD